MKVRILKKPGTKSETQIVLEKLLFVVVAIIVLEVTYWSAYSKGVSQGVDHPNVLDSRGNVNTNGDPK